MDFENGIYGDTLGSVWQHVNGVWWRRTDAVGIEDEPIQRAIDEGRLWKMTDLPTPLLVVQLHERLEEAQAKLRKLWKEYDDDDVMDEANRLAGKISGVGLALSYLDEVLYRP